MNFRVLIILFVFLIWCLLALWWYHDRVICNCATANSGLVNTADTLKKDSVIVKSPVDTSKFQSKPDSTTSVKMHDTLLVYFPVNSTQDNPDKITQTHIEEMIEEMGSTGKKILITGHSDSQGKPEKNLVLGLKRANQLKELFVKKGAKSENISTFSKGQTMPIGDNATEAGRAKNRRAEAVLK